MFAVSTTAGTAAVAARAAAKAHGSCACCRGMAPPKAMVSRHASKSSRGRRARFVLQAATKESVDWKQPEDWPFKEFLVPADASPELRAKIVEEERAALLKTAHDDLEGSKEAIAQLTEGSFETAEKPMDNGRYVEARPFAVPLVDGTTFNNLPKDMHDFTDRKSVM